MHTPGPWHIVNGQILQELPQYHDVVSPKGKVVRNPIRNARHIIVSGVRPSDARLIAAAPDLLEACKAALIVVPMLAPETCTEADRRRLIENLNAAIAKAEGR